MNKAGVGGRTETPPPDACAGPMDGDVTPSTSSAVSPAKRKQYRGLVPAANEANRSHRSTHSRDRSISDFISEPIHVVRPRIPTVSGPGVASDSVQPTGVCLKREEYLAVTRGLAPHAAGLPSPPQSDQGKDGSDTDVAGSVDDRRAETDVIQPPPEYFYATGIRGSEGQRRWRALRMLGQGTFSKVILAISDDPEGMQDADGDGPRQSVEWHQDGRPNLRRLVAVKIVEHGPAGGASEDRIETSLKRELDIMKSIHHPSLVHLKAFNVEPTRALLVMSYCPGGDLFDFASQRRSLLSPALIRRIFAELVTATLYLHERLIVHRDIKLESTYTPLSCPLTLSQTKRTQQLIWTF